MPSWPSGVPQFLIGGFTETPGDNLIVSPTDTGPPKRRRRSTAGPSTVQGVLRLTAAQLATWRAFVSTDLAEGALSFDWTHPVSGAATTALVNNYSVASAGARYTVSVEMEVRY